jgi:hypothetical protein
MLLLEIMEEKVPVTHVGIHLLSRKRLYVCTFSALGLIKLAPDRIKTYKVRADVGANTLNIHSALPSLYKTRPHLCILEISG